MSNTATMTEKDMLQTQLPILAGAADSANDFFDGLKGLAKDIDVPIVVKDTVESREIHVKPDGTAILKVDGGTHEITDVNQHGSSELVDAIWRHLRGEMGITTITVDVLELEPVQV